MGMDTLIPFQRVVDIHTCMNYLFAPIIIGKREKLKGVC
jgi:hypothetical protein